MALVYSAGNEADAEAMAALLRAASLEFITPGFTADASERFLDGNDAVKLRATMAEGAFYFVSREGDDIAGMIGVVQDTHVKYLFVGGRWHRRGIARRLLDLAIAEMQRRGPVAFVTLNASDYGLEAYKRMGFVVAAPRQEREGVWFTPMRFFPDPVGACKPR